MMRFLHREKNRCNMCHERFDKQPDLVQNAKNVHHLTKIRCRNCGLELLHEEDRLHHAQQEKEKEVYTYMLLRGVWIWQKN
jgi:hypothetical protein